MPMADVSGGKQLQAVVLVETLLFHKSSKTNKCINFHISVQKKKQKTPSQQQQTKQPTNKPKQETCRICFLLQRFTFTTSLKNLQQHIANNYHNSCRYDTASH